jgi:chromosome segregation ATPase
MESFTREEMEIHKAQVELFREQILNCSREVTAVRREVANSAEQSSKASALQAEELAALAARQQEATTHTDLAAALAALRRSLRDEQSAAQGPVLQRLASLEASKVAASCQHAETLDSIKGANAQIANAHSRLANLESFLNSAFGNQSKAQPQGGQASTFCSNASDCLKVRLAALERTVADAAEDNACALKAAHAMFEDISYRLAVCEGQHMDLQGLQADLAERFDLVADGDGQHTWTQQLGDLDESQAVDIGQRLSGVDDALGEISKKFESLHARLAAHEQSEGRALLSASLQERAHDLEVSLSKANSAGTTCNEYMQAIQARLDQMHARLVACERSPAEVAEAKDDAKAAAFAVRTELACRVKQLESEGLAAEEHREALGLRLEERLEQIEWQVSHISDRHAEDIGMACGQIEKMNWRLQAVQGAWRSIAA